MWSDFATTSVGLFVTRQSFWMQLHTGPAGVFGNENVALLERGQRQPVSFSIGEGRWLESVAPVRFANVGGASGGYAQRITGMTIWTGSQHVSEGQFWIELEVAPLLVPAGADYEIPAGIRLPVP